MEATQFKKQEYLATIAKRTGPNKKYLCSFLCCYEKLFSNIRNESLTILEIGIGGYKDPNSGGGSLRMWSEFFPNAKIIGLDNCVKNLSLPTSIEVKFGSQTNTEMLKSLVVEYSGFDIIIDDASHITSNTILTFETLWPHTKMFYIVEDLHMKKAKGTKEYFEKIDGSNLKTPNLCIVYK